MRKSIMAAALAPLFAAALAVSQSAAQVQDPPRQTPDKPQPRATMAQQPTTTLAGCLYREDQVPGRRPNVAERAGVLEDYVLADASVAGTQAKPDTMPGATGTTGAMPSGGNMYKVAGPSDEKLKTLVGKRVEVMGRIEREGAAGTTPGEPREDRGPGPGQMNLPKFEATSIREVSGTCPATPAPRK